MPDGEADGNVDARPHSPSGGLPRPVDRAQDGCPGRLARFINDELMSLQQTEQLHGRVFTAPRRAHNSGGFGHVVSHRYGDAAQIVAAADPVEANRAQVPASVNSENVSCKELKDKLESAGSLTILSGPKGWGDTFYGPRVPQCQFWTRPVFSYVSTRDGLCGVGYICVEKLGSAGGG